MTAMTVPTSLTGSPEHEAFRAAVRAFVENEINPNADAWEEAGTWPAHEVLPKLAALGALGLEYDEADGGQGADHSYTVVLAEELGRADCAGVPMGIAVQAAMATPALARHGSPELKARYLAPALRGELVCSIAVSEPDAGSDVGGIRTRARRDGDDWVIDGRKMWITNGSQADWVCLLARTSDVPGYGGMSLIVVPTSTAGFSVGRLIKKMGNHSSDTAELVLDGVRVPVSNTVGEPGQGFYLQMQQFQDERLIGAYMAVSGARRAIDRTIDYLQQREAFGKPLMANQHLQYRLAELVADVDVVHEYCLAAAARKVAGEDVTRMATIAKLKAGRLARDVADTAVQFHGGMGYAEDLWVARYFRDTRLISIGGGADEVMLRVLALLEGMGRR
ncbi:MAG TPA: acyl-CoA dehydrogenase family protein [Candidatus Nanopelagicales bacterium]|nr:acyl-CoA dehydrogenase family protein [Candidatus Nanopelagicales bacterium]